MLSLEDALALLSVATWSDGDRGKRHIDAAVNEYLGSVGPGAAERFAALQQLRDEAADVLHGLEHARWTIALIDTRLAEEVASMVNAGVPAVHSDPFG